MADELDLIQLASAGEMLATVDGTEYRAVQLVLALEATRSPAVYCQYRDWPRSHAARLAAKEEEIGELAAILNKWAIEATAEKQRSTALERRVAELEQQLAERTAVREETPAENQAKQLSAQAAYLSGARETPPLVDPISCPDCGEAGWKSARALQMHRQRSHQGMQAIKAAPVQFVEELGWRCAAKGCTGAHARDLHDPAFCTLHATPRTNGHEIAA